MSIKKQAIMANTTKKQVIEEQEELKSIQDNEPLPSSSSENEEDLEGFSEGEEEEEENATTNRKGSHTIKKLDKKKNLAKVEGGNENNKELSSIIYVSRLPQGFHERELSKYFSQFGDLKQVRLARNKKTGNSRHYAFIEFVNKDDALVAQDTMNNYLILGHLLKVVVLPKGKKIEKLFKYKKRVYQETPVKKDVEELKERARAKHDERVSKLKEQGIEFKW